MSHSEKCASYYCRFDTRQSTMIYIYIYIYIFFFYFFLNFFIIIFFNEKKFYARVKLINSPHVM